MLTIRRICMPSKPSKFAQQVINTLGVSFLTALEISQKTGLDRVQVLDTLTGTYTGKYFIKLNKSSEEDGYPLYKCSPEGQKFIQ
jgi:hypothetical protein